MAGAAAEATATVAQLAAEVARLQTALDTMTAERDRYRHLYEQLREAYPKLEHGRRGQQAERLPPDDRQLTLGLLDTLLGDDAPSTPSAQPVRAHARRPPTGRQPLPDHLPRVKIELVPLDVQRQGLDQFERIGAEVSEVLERRPASAVVVEVIRPKFVPKQRDRLGPTRVLIAEPAELPIPRGRAGPGMLADSIVRRWQDHQPLHRLEGIYARDGLTLNRSTVCGWHEELADLARPLLEAMLADALRQPVPYTDATGPTYCRWRLRADGDVGLPSPSRAAPFVELVVPTVARDAPAGLEIVPPAGYRVRLGEAVVAATLRTVLDVLEARG